MATVWALTGDPLPPEDPAINIDRQTGFSPAMSLPGGPPVPRQVFNWSWRIFSTLGSEVNQHGVLEWSDQVNYLHTAQVSKNGRAFISTVNSGPGVPIDAVDPELAGQTAWVELLRVGILRWNDIDGILPVAKGGTGVSSIPSLRALLNIPEAAQGTLPIGGDVGEILQKTGSGDFVVDWQRLSWDDIDGILPINRGGTGSTSSSGARSSLGAARSGHSHPGYARDPHTHPTQSLDDLFGTLSVSKGGTGADSPAGARASLGAAAATHNHAGSGTYAVVIGAVVWWPGLFSMIPDGWLEADGAAISRATYDVAFSALGTTWGNGNGSTTFNIPNYQGRVLVGKRATDSVGDRGGARAVSLTSANLGSHTHAIPSHTHSIRGHSHGVDSHSHNVSSHSHSVSSHSHSGAAHVHSVDTHSHSVSPHVHSVDSHSHSVSPHLHSVSSHSHSGASHSRSASAHTHTVSGHTHGLSSPQPLGDAAVQPQS